VAAFFCLFPFPVGEGQGEDGFMKFSELVEQVLALLRRQGRVSYRALKREFDLDDDFLADLKEELQYSHAGQVQEEGPGLVWTGTNAEGEKAKGRKGEAGENSGS